jgi:hypothetical protein
MMAHRLSTAAMTALILMGFAACFFNWSACLSDDKALADRQTSADDDDDDDIEDGPSQHCLEILEILYFDCGAQFYDDQGNGISFGSMTYYCDLKIVECIVGCGDEFGECSAIQICLEDRCDLL